MNKICVLEEGNENVRISFHRGLGSVTVDILKYMDINKMLILLSSLRYGSEGHVDVVKFHLVETPSLLLSYSKSIMYPNIKTPSL